MHKFKILFFITLLFINIEVVLAEETSTPTSFETYSTLHSIGIEWGIEGDDNHDANCQVRYKQKGTSVWKEALDLYRIDYSPVSARPDVGGDASHFNGFAGSVMFLKPNRIYQVELTLTDPDGGTYTRTESVSTKKMPIKPYTSRTFHVVPGAGDGNGTEENPFHGIEVAQAQAEAGDTFLLHAGHYQGFDEDYRVSFTKGGTIDNYILWQAAGDGNVTMDSISIRADYMWFEDIHFKAREGVYQEYGVLTFNGPQDIVLKHDLFTGFHYSITVRDGGAGWIITDNTIIGDKDINVTDEGTASWDGEGIELVFTGGHTIAHNSISLAADGISSALKNVDIFGNELFDLTDDGIEPDYGYANIRVWGNRLSNVRHHAFSFQPMNRGPWYFLRNQVAAPSTAVLKTSITSRALLAHNTFVTYGHGFDLAASTFDIKNNLWIALDNNTSFLYKASDSLPLNWRAFMDYNAFDIGNRVSPFQFGGYSYTSLSDFQTATELELHSVTIDKESSLVDLNITHPAPVSVPFEYFTLSSSSPAVDAGVLLHNINEDFIGERPDMGAYEFNGTLPHYGVRPHDPSHLVFTDINKTAVTLSWTNTQEQKSGFKIFRDDILIHTTDENTTTYTDTNLSLNTTYIYTVKTTN